MWTCITPTHFVKGNQHHRCGSSDCDTTIKRSITGDVCALSGLRVGYILNNHLEQDDTEETRKIRIKRVQLDQEDPFNQNGVLDKRRVAQDLVKHFFGDYVVKDYTNTWRVALVDAKKRGVDIKIHAATIKTQAESHVLLESEVEEWIKLVCFFYKNSVD